MVLGHNVCDFCFQILENFHILEIFHILYLYRELYTTEYQAFNILEISISWNFSLSCQSFNAQVFVFVWNQ